MAVLYTFAEPYLVPRRLTTIPALANVGTTGGSIAQLASGDGGETMFVLVNIR